MYNLVRQSTTFCVSDPCQITDPTLDRACPVCGSAVHRPHLQKGELRLVQCCKCRMVFASPVPAAYASGQFYDLAGTSYYLTPDKLESDYSDVRFERELRFFRHHCRQGKVLDVGCSSGAFLYQLNRRFPGDYQAVGTDVSGPALDYAESRGVTVRRGDFLQQDWSGEHFAAITFWAVLEHLANPSAFLARAAELLEPGGRCFVLVPNFRSLATRLLGRRYRYLYPQHLNYFASDTLIHLVSSRFHLETMTTTHFNPIIIWQDWRSGGKEVPNQARAALLKRTTRLKRNPLMFPARTVYAASEHVLGSLGLADNLLVLLNKSPSPSP